MSTYNISEDESTRIRILKYIAIVFVVYIHSYAVNVNFADGSNKLLVRGGVLVFETFVSQVIARCGVPIFFLISSVLLFKNQRKYLQTIKNKTKTLLIPYLFWNTFWIMVYIVLQRFSFTAQYFSGTHTPILQSTPVQWLQLYGIGSETPHLYPLWFMRDLMVVTLFFPIIGKLTNRFPKQVLFTSIVLLFVPTSFPFKTALAYFCIGACIVKLQIHLSIFDDIPAWKMLMLYCVSAFVTLIVDNRSIDVIFIFIGIIFWTRISKCIYDSKCLCGVFLRLSQWTFMIYVTHELTLSSLKKICFRLLPQSQVWILFEYLVLPIIVIVGCSIAGALYQRFLPKLYSLTTGQR